MAKLKGKAKAKFLRRMAAGRRRKSKGKSRTKTKRKSKRRTSKSKKRRKSNPGTAKKASRRSRAISKGGKFFKGFLGGAGSAQLAGDGVALVTDNPTAQVLTKFGAATVGGYYVGNKSVLGAAGGVVAELVDLGLNLARGGGGVGTSRFSRL